MDYNVEDLIENYKDKNYIDIVIQLTKEVNQLESLSIASYKKKTKIQGLESYFKHARDFLFFLNTGGTPFGIGLVGLSRFLPIIKNLVEKGQLNPDVLDRFSTRT